MWLHRLASPKIYKWVSQLETKEMVDFQSKGQQAWDPEESMFQSEFEIGKILLYSGENLPFFFSSQAFNYLDEAHIF